MFSSPKVWAQTDKQDSVDLAEKKQSYFLGCGSSLQLQSYIE